MSRHYFTPFIKRDYQCADIHKTQTTLTAVYKTFMYGISLISGKMSSRFYYITNGHTDRHMLIVSS